MQASRLEKKTPIQNSRKRKVVIDAGYLFNTDIIFQHTLKQSTNTVGYVHKSIGLSIV